MPLYKLNKDVTINGYPAEFSSYFDGTFKQGTLFNGDLRMDNWNLCPIDWDDAVFTELVAHMGDFIFPDDLDLLYLHLTLDMEDSSGFDAEYAEDVMWTVNHEVYGTENMIVLLKTKEWVDTQNKYPRCIMKGPIVLGEYELYNHSGTGEWAAKTIEEALEIMMKEMAEYGR